MQCIQRKYEYVTEQTIEKVEEIMKRSKSGKNCNKICKYQCGFINNKRKNL